MFRIIKKLETANPFIYLIRGNYYYLGSTICRECTSEEIDTYKELKQEFDFLKNCSYKLNPKDCIKFNECFDNVISSVDDEYSHGKKIVAMNQIRELIKLFSEDEIIEWFEQYNIRQQMYNYRQGNFYSY